MRAADSFKQEGSEARKAGKLADANPYQPDSNASYAWMTGYMLTPAPANKQPANPTQAVGFL